MKPAPTRWQPVHLKERCFLWQPGVLPIESAAPRKGVALSPRDPAAVSRFYRKKRLGNFRVILLETEALEKTQKIGFYLAVSQTVGHGRLQVPEFTAAVVAPALELIGQYPLVC